MPENRIRNFLNQGAPAPKDENWIPATLEEIQEVAEKCTKIYMSALESLGLIPHSSVAYEGIVVPGLSKNVVSPEQVVQLGNDVYALMITTVNLAAIRSHKDERENFFILIDNFTSLLLTLVINKQIGVLRKK